MKRYISVKFDIPYGKEYVYRIPDYIDIDSIGEYVLVENYKWYEGSFDQMRYIVVKVWEIKPIGYIPDKEIIKPIVNIVDDAKYNKFKTLKEGFISIINNMSEKNLNDVLNEMRF